MKRTEAECKQEYDADCAHYWNQIKNDKPTPTPEEIFRMGYARGVMFASLTMAQAMADDLKESWEARANLT